VEHHSLGAHLGDRRTFYTAGRIFWNLVTRIAAGRKAGARSCNAALRECVEMSRDDESVDPVVSFDARNADFVERLAVVRTDDHPKRSTIPGAHENGRRSRAIADRGGKEENRTRLRIMETNVNPLSLWHWPFQSASS